MEWIKRLLGKETAKRPADRDMNRNDPCWCGSGSKYKACHLEADQAEDAKKACGCSTFG